MIAFNLQNNSRGLTQIAARMAMSLAIAAFGLASASASTIYGGFEDTVGGDYDYNDLVFSLSGDSLALHSTGTYFAKPAVLNSTGAMGQNGTPFWNNVSADGPNENIGYCIYVGCSGAAAINPNVKYLASFFHFQDRVGERCHLLGSQRR